MHRRETNRNRNGATVPTVLVCYAIVAWEAKDSTMAPASPNSAPFNTGNFQFIFLGIQSFASHGRLGYGPKPSYLKTHLLNSTTYSSLDFSIGYAYLPASSIAIYLFGSVKISQHSYYQVWVPSQSALRCQHTLPPFHEVFDESIAKRSK